MNHPGDRRAGLGTPVWALLGASLALIALVGALGDSAATPGLGPRTPNPPWDLAAHPPAWSVTVLLALGYGLGAAGVLLGLRALAAGARPAPRTLALAGVAAVAVLVLVPPVGSADHLSYLAYGRIAAAGDDPYTVAPIDWRAGTDPVAGAVQPPWQHTPSVYGPVGTAVQALAAIAGDGSLRRSVFCWQLLCGLAFLLVGLLLDRMAGAGPERRARAGLLWTVNPLLLGQLVSGAHLDVLAAAFGVAALALALRRPTVAGAIGVGLLLGAAVGTKAPYALFGLAVLLAGRDLPRRRAAVLAGAVALAALAVLVPGHLWAGPHVFDQLGQASRFTSLATPWRGVANLGDLLLGRGALRGLITPLALLLAAALVPVLWRRRVADLPAGAAGDAGRAALALTAAWVFTAPYALPWYDAMVWAPLALVGPSLLDRLVLARSAVLALAYVPGRVVELTPTLERVTLAIRGLLAPVLVALLIAVLVRWASARRPADQGAG